MEHESLRSALRDRTRGLHARLDAALTGPGGRVRDLPGYLRVLRSLHALHAHADVPLRRWAKSSALAEALDPALLPRRADAYAADLTILGETVPTRSTDEGRVGDARGLALLYLVAGSAAGARVLLGGLPDAVPADARRGLTHAAGRTSTTLWRDTVALLERPTSRQLRDAVIAEARGVLEGLLDEQNRQELVVS